MKSLYNIRFKHMKLPKPWGIKLLAVICVISLFDSLFGCGKKPSIPSKKKKLIITLVKE